MDPKAYRAEHLRVYVLSVFFYCASSLIIISVIFGIVKAFVAT